MPDSSIFPTISYGLIYVAATLVFACVALWHLKSYLGISGGLAARIIIGSLVGGVAVGLVHFMNNSRVLTPNYQIWEYLLVNCTARGFLVLLGLPLLVRIYRSWMGWSADERELQPGIAGLRAWFTPLDLGFAFFAALSAYFGLGLPVVPVFIGLVAALLVQALLQTTMTDNPSTSSENLSPERERVLSLLEQGKITAEESADLLRALGASKKPAPPAGPAISPTRRLVFIGALLVVAGFFLPWFSINPAREISKIFGQMLGGTPMNSSVTFSSSPGAPMLPPPDAGAAFPAPFGNATIKVSGADIGHGLGWIVLLLALGAAMMSYIFPQIAPAMQRRYSLLLLVAGAFLLLYISSRLLDSMNIGLLLVAAGYALEFTGIFRSSIEPRPASWERDGSLA